MSLLPILEWPDPRLGQPCEAVESIDEVTPLLQDMFETMYAAPGRGLAAPQVGVMKRFFVMDCHWKEAEMTPVVMINPVIMARENRAEVMSEGCLSIPGLMVPVERPVAVTVQWMSQTGEYHMDDFDGFEARCIQHEMDHLAGRVTLDHLDAETRERMLEGYAP